MLSRYQYISEDRSLLLPFLKRWVWQPMLRVVPYNVSPNALTTLGTFCALASFVFALLIPPKHHVFLFISALLAFAYVTLDNLDGMQARRTQRSSQLGEFLDHWFDCFNTGFIVMGLYFSAGISPSFLILLIAITNMAHFATMWEQRHTGILRLTRFGTIEGILFTTILYASLAFVGRPIMTDYKLFNMFSIFELTGYIMIVNNVALTGSTGWRNTTLFIKNWVEWFLPICTTTLLFIWFMKGQASLIVIGFVLILSNVLFAGRQIIARISGRTAVRHDVLFTVLLAISIVLSFAYKTSFLIQNVCAWILFAYLIVRVALDFIETSTVLLPQRDKSYDLPIDEKLF